MYIGNKRIGYFLLYPIPFFIVLIGWTFYKEEGLPTDVEIYVGAYLIALIFSFVFLFARAKWRAATPKQKKNVIVGQLTTTVSFVVLDIFLPTSISGAIQGPEAFTAPWFMELILYSFVGYWLIYMTYKILYFYFKETSDFNKKTYGIAKEAKVIIKEKLKHIRTMHKISQGEIPEDYIKETLSTFEKNASEVVSEKLSTIADQTSKEDKT